jgi:hypothetical protein
MQRELRLGDILDDYCPRERRLTNHAIVAMVGQDVKQTRCTTCDAEHEYKHAKVPRQRRKADTPPALYSQVLAGAPKRVSHEAVAPPEASAPAAVEPDAAPFVPPVADSPAPTQTASAAAPETPSGETNQEAEDEDHDRGEQDTEQGPVHRALIRATLPRPEGQAPPARPAPEFTIRQPGGRPGRFRPRHQRGGPAFQGNRSMGNVGGPRGMSRQNTGRPQNGPAASRIGRHDAGRKRSK